MFCADYLHSRTSIAGMVVCLVTIAAWLDRPSAALRPDPADAAGFSFEHYALTFAGTSPKTVRSVHPSLRHLESWISSVGAAVALNDMDGDGLANDVCLVDPRTDTVTIAPVPGTAKRYEPFLLRRSGATDPTTAPMGCLPGDFNQDGNMDVLVYYWGRPPVIFNFREAQRGKPLGPTSYTAEDLSDPANRWYTNAVVTGDLDGDGIPDLLIANYFPDGSEILNANDTSEQRLHTSMSHAHNGGGKHVFLGARKRGSTRTVFRETTPEIFDNKGMPLRDAEAQSILRGWTLAVSAADLNGDMLPEIYIANDFGPDHLLRNRSTPGQPKFQLINGHRTFTTPKSKVVGNDSFKGMGVDLSDLNAEGRLNILVSNISEEYGLQESNFAFINHCDPSAAADLSSCFSDESERLGLSRSGWAWDIKAGDFDNSGSLQIIQATGFLKAPSGEIGINRWPELHETAMGNDVLLRFPSAWHDYHTGDDLSGQDRNHFYVRRTSGRFVDISDRIGLRHDAVSRGVAIADVDGDGRLDFAVANQWGDSDLYHNIGAGTGKSITLRLLLPLDTKAGFSVAPLAAVCGAAYAMTAEAMVDLQNGRRMLQQVNGGNGHSGKNSFDLHFGLGAVKQSEPVPIDLRWRDKTGHVRTRRLSLPAGRYNILLGV